MSTRSRIVTRPLLVALVLVLCGAAGACATTRSGRVGPAHDEARLSSSAEVVDVVPVVSQAGPRVIIPAPPPRGALTDARISPPASAATAPERSTAGAESAFMAPTEAGRAGDSEPAVAESGLAGTQSATPGTEGAPVAADAPSEGAAPASVSEPTAATPVVLANAPDPSAAPPLAAFTPTDSPLLGMVKKGPQGETPDPPDPLIAPKADGRASTYGYAAPYYGYAVGPYYGYAPYYGYPRFGLGLGVGFGPVGLGFGVGMPGYYRYRPFAYGPYWGGHGYGYGGHGHYGHYGHYGHGGYHGGHAGFHH